MVEGLRVLPQEEHLKRGGNLDYVTDFRALKPFEGARLAQAARRIDALRAAGTPFCATELIWLPRDLGLALCNLPDTRFTLTDFETRFAVGVWELAALPGALARADVAPKDVADGLQRVASTRVAGFMARLFARTRAEDGRADAEAWLLRFPRTAAIGLIPSAVGPLGPARDEAEGALRWIDFRGSGAIIREVGARYGVAAVAAIEEVLGHLPAPTKAPALPTYLDTAVLPTVRFREGEALDGNALANLLRLLAAWPAVRIEDLVEVGDDEEGDGEEDGDEEGDGEGDGDEEGDGEGDGDEDPGEDNDEGGLENDGLRRIHVVHRQRLHPGVLGAKQACDPASLDALAGALLDAWLAADAPARDKWLLFAASAVGGEDFSRRLGPLVGQWWTEKKRARAVLGLDALMHLATGPALASLASIAERPALQDLAREARHRLDCVERARGVSA